MDDFIKKFFAFLRTLPVVYRIVFLALLAALAAIVSLSSCARSTMTFRGTGELQYEYRGAMTNSWNSK